MIERALEIPGWMTPQELQWLAEQASTHQRVLEVGTWRGRSTRALADNTQGVVYTVDDWSGAGWDYGEPLDNVRQQFYRNLAGPIARGAVVPVVLSSTEAAASQALPRWFDMVFIDGDHTYEAVKHDIGLWAPRLQPGGLLCGHDWGNHPGVTRAVQELLAGMLQLVEGTSIWARTRAT